MAQKIFKASCGMICFLGFLILLGTAGSSDLNLIYLSQTVRQSVAGLVLFIAGGYFGKILC